MQSTWLNSSPKQPEDSLQTGLRSEPLSFEGPGVPACFQAPKHLFAPGARRDTCVCPVPLFVCLLGERFVVSDLCSRCILFEVVVSLCFTLACCLLCVFEIVAFNSVTFKVALLVLTLHLIQVPYMIRIFLFCVDDLHW